MFFLSQRETPAEGGWLHLVTTLDIIHRCRWLPANTYVVRTCRSRLEDTRHTVVVFVFSCKGGGGHGERRSPYCPSGCCSSEQQQQQQLVAAPQSSNQFVAVYVEEISDATCGRSATSNKKVCGCSFSAIVRLLFTPRHDTLINELTT